MLVRLQKFMADCGVASRRHSEELIRKGKVRLNGTVVKELGVKCDPAKDRVEVSGRLIKPQTEFQYILFNKPRGVTSTKSDRFAEKTLTDALPTRWKKLKPVGRLDKWSEGLMLLTNHGELINRLTHPSFEEEKEYLVEVNGVPRKSAFDRMERGIKIGEYKTQKTKIIKIEQMKEATSFHIILKEGKKRQIRRMCEAVDYKVRRLRRVRVGFLKIGNLPVGKCRELSKQEISRLTLALNSDKTK